MKKIFKLTFVFLILLAGIIGYTNNVVYADEETPEVTTTAAEGERTEINLYMFRGEGCGYCAKALEWFEEIEAAEGKYFKLVTYEVWNDETNSALMKKVANYLGDDVSGVPYIIVGKKTFQGFDESYKEQILEAVHSEYNKNLDERFDVIKNIENGEDKKVDNTISYIICIIIIAVIILIVVARFKSGEDNSVNYEYEEEKNEEFDDYKREEVEDEEVVEEKVRETKEKTSTNKKSSSNGYKPKSSGNKRGRKPKNKE
jgi:glutaredoxin